VATLSEITRTADNQNATVLKDALAVHQRICVLQHQRRLDEATAMQSEHLQPLLDQIAAQGLISPDELTTALESERKRVDDAALLACLLAPLLADQLGTNTAGLQSSDLTSPKSISTARPRPPPPANIAGFIDEMLSKQKSTGRP
jgi:hypothetical protein